MKTNIRIKNTTQSRCFSSMKEIIENFKKKKMNINATTNFTISEQEMIFKYKKKLPTINNKKKCLKTKLIMKSYKLIKFQFIISSCPTIYILNLPFLSIERT